jgi:hypothetical protein
MEVEGGEVGVAGGTDALPGLVGVDVVEVDRGGAEDVGQSGLGLASVSARADAGAAHGLGDGALDAGAFGVSQFPGIGVLLGALVLEEFVFLAGVQGQTAGEAAGA